LEKTYELSGCKLVVSFEKQLIRIASPQGLQKFLSQDIEMRSEILVNYIKLDYLNFIGKELAVSNDSIMVEIWGHLYASYFAKSVKNLIRLKFIRSTADLIIERSETIDCGEKEVDSNRWIWDLLANFKGIIIKCLPKRLKRVHIAG